MNQRSPFICHSATLEINGQRIAFRRYVLEHAQQPRRLLLLHGAGVAGRHTWEGLLRFLTGWSEILVPDLRGAGNTQSMDGEEHPFRVEDLVNDMLALLDHLGWQQFDLGGYSLGGLVAMLIKQRLGACVEKQYLLESAVLDRLDWRDTIQVRQSFAKAADVLHQQEAESGIRAFLDIISPNRRLSEQVEKLTIARLAERSKGFAHALEAVTAAIHELDRETLLAAQGDVSSFIGGLSVDPMHQLHRTLAERLPNWHYFLIPGTDHSLPFQKPRQIAQMMDAELVRYLGQ